MEMRSDLFVPVGGAFGGRLGGPGSVSAVVVDEICLAHVEKLGNLVGVQVEVRSGVPPVSLPRTARSSVTRHLACVHSESSEGRHERRRLPVERDFPALRGPGAAVP